MNNIKLSGKRVVVGLSGGVDSSVAAALLQDRGMDVVGVMLRLWSEPGKENICCDDDGLRSARQIAGKLGIPFHAVNAEEDFFQQVVQPFVDGYTKCITPNPCLRCNRYIRWGFLLKQMRLYQADFIATGHYARLVPTEVGKVQLLKGKDPTKDQSYVLHVLPQADLQQTLLPLGNLTKKEVRQLAADYKLPAAQRPDSQDLCFVSGGDYRRFLENQNPGSIEPGPIQDPDGNLLGQHFGLAFYTIGQRKGLGISPPEPHYVLQKITETNTLIVGPREKLGKKQLTAEKFNWISGQAPEQPFRAEVKIRYQSSFEPALIQPAENQTVLIQFEKSLPDITPGQAAVVYQGEICLGGGTIGVE
jgi:tRNA-specific 2-thiouridylase